MKKLMILVLCSLTAAMATGYGPVNVMAKTTSQTASVSDVLAQQMAKADGEAEEDVSDAEDAAEEEKGSVSGAEGTAKDPAGEQSDSKDGQNGSSGGAVQEEEFLYEDIDVDLTILSSTMVYSEVFNMMVSPDTYIGKTVKLDGLFTYYYDEAADVYYYACIVQDATACCAQGIEFVPLKECVYPDDFPEVGGEISVTGVFDTYKEGEYQYCTLRDALFEIC